MWGNTAEKFAAQASEAANQRARKHVKGRAMRWEICGRTWFAGLSTERRKQMKQRFASRFAMWMLALVMTAAVVPAMANSAGESADKTAKKIRKELVTLPYYGVFDNLSFKVEDG